MKSILLIYLLLMLAGNYFWPVIILVVAYFILDRMYTGPLSGFFNSIRRNKRIKSILYELSLNPSNANASLEAGILYFEKKNYNNAMLYLDKAKERIDDSARLHCFRGMACIELKHFKEGFSELTKALDLNKDVGYGIPYIYFIYCELNKEPVDYKEIARHEAALSRYSNAENYYRLGKLFKLYRNREKAKEMFTLSIKEYTFCNKSLRRLHRRWALLSRINRLL